ncbi:hypothetical protein CCP1ISM_8670001 [Azospirillaceae bacterium]
MISAAEQPIDGFRGLILTALDSADGYRGAGAKDNVSILADGERMFLNTSTVAVQCRHCQRHH